MCLYARLALKYRAEVVPNLFADGVAAALGAAGLSQCVDCAARALPDEVLRTVLRGQTVPLS